MSFGKMRTFIKIVLPDPVKDSEGFTVKSDTVLARVWAYKEDRHGSAAWRNRAAFSKATALFRFRVIPGLEITTAMVILCDEGRFSILSVENVKGRGMYIETLCERVMPGGKG